MSAASDNVVDGKEENAEVDEQQSTPVENPCPVCLSNRVDESRVDGCTHTFCYKCITEWLKVSESCPLCKAQVTEVTSTVNGKPRIKKLHELKAEVEAARIISGGNEVPMTLEIEAVTQLIDQLRASVQKIKSNKAMYKRNKHVIEQHKSETAQLTALKEEMGRLPRSGVMGDPRFRRVIYKQQLMWKSITRPSTAFRFNSAVACADPDKLMDRVRPFLMRELMIVLEPTRKPSDRVLQLILNAVKNHEINNPNFETILVKTGFFNPDYIGTFSHLLYEFCASGLELEAFDANSTYGLDPARGPIIIDSDIEEDDDDVIVDREIEPASWSSNMTGLLTNPSQIHPSLLGLSTDHFLETAIRDMHVRRNNLIPAAAVPILGTPQYLRPYQSVSRRIADPEVISLEDEPASGDVARINSIDACDIFSRRRDDRGREERDIAKSWREEKERKEEERRKRRHEEKEDGGSLTTESRRKRRHEEKKEGRILGVRADSRKNGIEYYHNKMMRDDLSADELEKMSGELTAFTDRIEYLREECNKQMAEKEKAKGRAAKEGGVIDVDDDVIPMEEDQPGPSNA